MRFDARPRGNPSVVDERGGVMGAGSAGVAPGRYCLA
jgi:hypothetical protein